jgi:hypothetical protein
MMMTFTISQIGLSAINLASNNNHNNLASLLERPLEDWPQISESETETRVSPSRIAPSNIKPKLAKKSPKKRKTSASPSLSSSLTSSPEQYRLVVPSPIDETGFAQVTVKLSGRILKCESTLFKKIHKPKHQSKDSVFFRASYFKVVDNKLSAFLFAEPAFQFVGEYPDPDSALVPLSNLVVWLLLLFICPLTSLIFWFQGNN